MSEEKDKSTIASSIKIYLDEINRISLLSPEEEVTLAREMESGKQTIEEIERRFRIPKERIVGSYKRYEKARGKKGNLPPELATLEREELKELVEWIQKVEERVEQARRRLIEANLKLVVSVAKRYSHCGLAFLDLIDEGNLGLMHATDRFDYKRGYRFSTYAVWWIRQAILRALASQGRMIRIPVYMVESIHHYLKIIRFLTQELGRKPTLEEVSRELRLPIEKVVEMARMADAEPVSLDAAVGDEREDRLGELIEDSLSPLSLEGSVFLEALREKIEELFVRLKDKERRILNLRYGLNGSFPHTLEETGQLLNISRERVRQIEKSTLNKLRRMKLTRELYDFLVE